MLQAFYLYNCTFSTNKYRHQEHGQDDDKYHY